MVITQSEQMMVQVLSVSFEGRFFRKPDKCDTRYEEFRIQK